MIIDVGRNHCYVSSEEIIFLTENIIRGRLTNERDTAVKQAVCLWLMGQKSNLDLGRVVAFLFGFFRLFTAYQFYNCSNGSIMVFQLSDRLNKGTN